MDRLSISYSTADHHIKASHVINKGLFKMLKLKKKNFKGLAYCVGIVGRIWLLDLATVLCSFIFWMLSSLGKDFNRQHFKIFLLFFPDYRFWYFLERTCTKGQNQKTENKKNIITCSLSCAELVKRGFSRPRWLSWMRRPTGDQEVAGSTPAEVGNILLWRLIMKYFLRSFSPFRWFKKGGCQFLAKECAQYWLTA